MKHCMIDLETMGTGPDAAIVAIGAVLFDPAAGGDGIGAQREWTIDLADAMQRGGRVDAYTIQWWLAQGEPARAALARRADSLVVALPALADWLRLHGVECAWGNGADFDLVILASAYRRAAIHWPITYRQHRCLRTLRALRPDVKVQAEGTHHTALADARWGARLAVQILRGLA